MDFSAFDSCLAADEGRHLQLRHPATDELLTDRETGEPCVVLVFGMEGSIAQAQLDEMAKLPKMADNAAMSELHNRFVMQAQKLVGGFVSGINRGKRPAKAPEDVLWFLNLQKVNPIYKGRSFVEQILLFSAQREEYLKKPEGDSSSPPISGDGSTVAPKTGRRTAK